jgi:hypothetical protein
MSELAGPFPLTHADLLTRLPAGAKGVFVLMTVYEGDPYVRLVGRSDSVLARDLMSFAGQYDQYAYQLCEDELASFLAECKAFHDYGGLKELANAVHPEPPLVNLFCPVCGFGFSDQQHGGG